MAAVEVEQRKSQLFATLHFIYKGIARFFQSFSNRMSEVNQITVVGKNLRRCVVIFFTGGFEFIDGLRRERCGTPLTLVFGEQGKRGCVDFGGANCGIARPPAALTCAPMYFMRGLLLNPLEENGNDSGLTGARCSGLCDDALNHIVNRTTTNNQPANSTSAISRGFAPAFSAR